MGTAEHVILQTGHLEYIVRLWIGGCGSCCVIHLCPHRDSEAFSLVHCGAEMGASFLVAVFAGKLVEQRKHSEAATVLEQYAQVSSSLDTTPTRDFPVPADGKTEGLC